MKTIDEDFSIYLTKQTGLNRLLEQFKLKYISLGRYSGTITLLNISSEESFDLSNLLGKNIKMGDTFKTSFKHFEKIISYTKYAGFTWDKLFYYYFGNAIISKKEKNNEENLLEKNFFDNIIKENSSKKFISNYKEIFYNDEIYKILNTKYKRNKDLLRNDLNNIILLLDNLPDIPTSLSVYASLTGNPHYLDLNNNSSNLFLHFLCRIKNVEFPINNIAKINLFEQINVYVDSISNFVITYKLIGDNLLNEFSNKNEILNLNLSNILNLSNNIDTKEKKVYIFENPSILNTLKELNVPMIITSGMPNLSLYKLLDILVKNGNNLYYNGDFDPEGLLIAQKLKDRYSNLELFGYDKNNYVLSKANQKLSLSRINKLKLVCDDKLNDIKEMLYIYKKAFYQENNIEMIKQYILKNKN